MTDIQDRIDVSTEINHLFPFSSPEGTPPTTPSNAAWIQSRFFTAEIPTNGQTFSWSESQNKWIYTMGEAGQGDATSLRGRPIYAGAPSEFDVLQWTAVGGWNFVAEATLRSSTSLRGRAITTAPPNDSDSLKWSASQNKWIYAPIDSGDAISLRSRAITTDAPDELDVLQWTAAGGWGYVPEATLRDALSIRGRAITSDAPDDLDVLQWSEDDSQWIAAPMSGGGGAIDFVPGKAYALQSINGLNDFRPDRGGVIGERNTIYGGNYSGLSGAVLCFGGGPDWSAIIGFDPANTIGDPDEVAPLFFCQVVGGGNVVDPAGTVPNWLLDIFGVMNTIENCNVVKVWGPANHAANCSGSWFIGTQIDAGPGVSGSFVFSPDQPSIISAGSNIVFADEVEIANTGRALVVGHGTRTSGEGGGSTVLGIDHLVGFDPTLLLSGGTPYSLIFGLGHRTYDSAEQGRLFVGGDGNTSDNSPGAFIWGGGNSASGSDLARIHGTGNSIVNSPGSEIFGADNSIGVEGVSTSPNSRIWGHDNTVNDTSSLFGSNSILGWDNVVDGLGAMIHGAGNTVFAGTLGATIFGNYNDVFGAATMVVGQLCSVDSAAWSGLFGESISLTDSEDSWLFGESITGADCHFTGAIGNGIDIGGTCNFAAGHSHLVRGAGNIVAGQANRVYDFKTGMPEANAVFGSENLVGGVDSIVAGRKHSVIDTTGKVALFGYGHEAGYGSEYSLWFGKGVLNGWYSSLMHGTGKDALGNPVGQNFPEIALWGKTTDATTTELFLDGPGGDKVLSTANWGARGAYLLDVLILAHRTDVRGQVKIWRKVLIVTEDPGADALVIQDPSMSSSWSTSLGNESSWSFSIDWQTLPTDYIRFQATGYSGESIHWQVMIRGAQAIEGVDYVP